MTSGASFSREKGRPSAPGSISRACPKRSRHISRPTRPRTLHAARRRSSPPSTAHASAGVSNWPSPVTSSSRPTRLSSRTRMRAWASSPPGGSTTGCHGPSVFAKPGSSALPVADSMPVRPWSSDWPPAPFPCPTYDRPPRSQHNGSPRWTPWCAPRYVSDCNAPKRRADASSIGEPGCLQLALITHCGTGKPSILFPKTAVTPAPILSSELGTTPIDPSTSRTILPTSRIRGSSSSSITATT